jgi:tetratricopeptide (TPR) repeat protein
LLLSGEALREFIGRHRRDAESLHNRGVLFANHGEYRRSFTCHRAAANIRPEDSTYLYSAGAAALAAGLWRDAASFLDTALRIDPHHAAAWQKRGEVYLEARKTEAALRSFCRAIELAPGNSENYQAAARCILSGHDAAGALKRLREVLPPTADPLHAERGVAMALADQGDYANAIPLLSGAVRQSPDDYTSMRILAELHTGLRERSTAEFWYQRAIAGNDFHSLVGWILHWSRVGDFDRGREIYRSRIKGIEFDVALGSPARRWEGQDIRSKTLHLIAGDIYLGDAVQYARFARVAKEAGATVILQVPRRLRFLLRTIEGVDAVTEPHDPAPAADYQAHAFWLMYALTVPTEQMIGHGSYLAPPVDVHSDWQDRIPRAHHLNVGLAWRGSGWRMRDRLGRRSMDLEDLRPLSAVSRARLFSLQYGAGRTELLQANPSFPAEDLAPDLRNICAVMERLDVVVTIDTFIAHLAGALGKRTFLMLPYDPCFRWMMDRDDTPWYRSVRLFRQSQPGAWADVVAAVAQALQQEPLER